MPLQKGYHSTILKLILLVISRSKKNEDLFEQSQYVKNPYILVGYYDVSKEQQMKISYGY